MTDYEINYRQFAFYIVDCEEIGCDGDSTLSKLTKLIEKSELPVPLAIVTEKPESATKLA